MKKAPQVSIAVPRLLAICGLSVALAAGCTLPPPPTTPAPTTTPKDSTTPAIAVKSWKPQHSPGSWRYELRSSATVTLTGDSSARALPISRTAVYTVTIVPNTAQDTHGIPFELTGSVDSVAVTTPERVPTPTAGSNVRPHFHAQLTSDGQVTELASDATTPCQATIDPLSAATTTLFVTVPPVVTLGTSWKDTISTATCRGRMAIITTVVRQYRAVTDTVWGNTEALLITRADSVHVRNRPDSTSDRMVADGTGSGEFTLYVDPKSGMLLAATGQSRTEILVINGDSRFPFHEEARQTISLVR